MPGGKRYNVGSRLMTPTPSPSTHDSMTVSAQTSAALVKQGSIRTAKRFWGAAVAPWRGLAFIMSTPASWPYALVPLVVASAIIGLLSALAVGSLPALITQLLPSSTVWYMSALRVVVQVLSVIAAVVLAVFMAALLAQPLSGPALGKLSRLYEEHLGLPARPEVSLATDVSRSARGALLGATSLPLLALLTAIELLFPGSTVVILPIKIFITGLFISWDFLDFPLSARDMGIGARLRWLSAHRVEVVGFGVSLAVVFLLPCAQLLLLPAGVVGATALAAKLDEPPDDA